MKAILCDVYQTLLQGIRVDHPEEHLQEVIKRYGLKWSYNQSVAEVLKSHIQAEHDRSPEPYPEVDIREIWQDIFPSLQDPDTFALDAENAVHQVSLMPGVLPALETWQQQGIRLGIVSNAQAYTRVLLRQHLGDSFDYFESELMAFSYEHRIAKPDPRLFKVAVSPLINDGISASEVMMIGDSQVNDVDPALTLGLKAHLLTAWENELKLSKP